MNRPRPPHGERTIDRFAEALSETGDVATAADAIEIDRAYGKKLYALLSWFKAQPKSWPFMAEREQRDLADAADRFAETVIKIARLLARWPEHTQEIKNLWEMQPVEPETTTEKRRRLLRELSALEERE